MRLSTQQGQIGRLREEQLSPDRAESSAIAGDDPGMEPGEELHALIVDRDVMSSHLIATALSQEKNIRASPVDAADLLRLLAVERAAIVIIGTESDEMSASEFELAQVVNRAYPNLPIVMLLNHSNRDSVLNAFRSGARGIFPRNCPVDDFLECVRHVRRGHIWAGEQEAGFLLEAIETIPSANLAASSDLPALTYRERQVVYAAVRGKTNKIIASELSLSEHTVKNYLFRAFQKLGVSNRVELLLCLTQRVQGSSRTTPRQKKADSIGPDHSFGSSSQ
jgi:two-component system nitrate/nitrite response regulator NarL